MLDSGIGILRDWWWWVSFFFVTVLREGGDPPNSHLARSVVQCKRTKLWALQYQESPQPSSAQGWLFGAWDDHIQTSTLTHALSVQHPQFGESIFRRKENIFSLVEFLNSFIRIFPNCEHLHWYCSFQSSYDSLVTPCFYPNSAFAPGGGICLCLHLEPASSQVSVPVSFLLSQLWFCLVVQAWSDIRRLPEPL